MRFDKFLTKEIQRSKMLVNKRSSVKIDKFCIDDMRVAAQIALLLGFGQKEKSTKDKVVLIMDLIYVQIDLKEI